MNIDYLKEFLVLAETLSFAKTAERFYTSRSAISRHVNALESEVGARLLERDRHNVSLTAEGEVFCKEARALLGDYVRLMENTRSASEGAEDIVRIGYLRNATRPYLVHFANYFRQAYPAIKLAYSCMQYDELCQAMAEGRLDLGLSMDFDGAFQGKYQAYDVYRDKLYAVVSKADPIVDDADDISCDDLVGRKVLMSSNLACPGLNDALTRAFGPKAAFISFEMFDDIDIVQLRLRIDGSIVLRSGHNARLSGEDTATLDIRDVDLSFAARAYIRKSQSARAQKACMDVVRECRQFMEEL